jgi:hypothetical protein
MPIGNDATAFKVVSPEVVGVGLGLGFGVGVGEIAPPFLHDKIMTDATIERIRNLSFIVNVSCFYNCL